MENRNAQTRSRIIDAPESGILLGNECPLKYISRTYFTRAGWMTDLALFLTAMEAGRHASSGIGLTNLDSSQRDTIADLRVRLSC